MTMKASLCNRFIAIALVDGYPSVTTLVRVMQQGSSGAYSCTHGNGGHVARGDMKSHAFLSKKYRILCRKMVCCALIGQGEVQPAIRCSLIWEDRGEPPTLSQGEIVDVDELLLVLAATKIVDSVDAFSTHGSSSGIGDDQQFHYALPFAYAWNEDRAIDEHISSAFACSGHRVSVKGRARRSARGYQCKLVVAKQGYPEKSSTEDGKKRQSTGSHIVTP
jgi:hypothetical protein